MKRRYPDATSNGYAKVSHYERTSQTYQTGVTENQQLLGFAHSPHGMGAIVLIANLNCLNVQQTNN